MSLNIYLAGPITGCSYDGCTNWRQQFKQLLPDTKVHLQMGFDLSELRVLSPMRGKDYLLGETNVADSYENELVLSCQRGIMTRDFFDCCRADIVVVNLLGAERVSIGTVMEIAWAFQNRTPVIAVMEKERNLHDHSMIRESIGFRVTTLEDAAEIALQVLWPKRQR